MVVCSVIGCTSRTTPSTYGRKHFFRFPKHDDQRRKLWIQFTRREKFDPKNSVICEDHFKTECFKPKKKGRLNLYENSVPTIYFREMKNKLQKIEIEYDSKTQEYKGAENLDFFYASTNIEREQEILNERELKMQQLKSLCRFCFESENEVKCVPFNKLEAYQIDPAEMLLILGLHLEHNEIFSEILCEKCFQQMLDIDTYRKCCQKAQADIVAELEEMDQKIEKIQSIKGNEKPWFKVEVIETTGDDVEVEMGTIVEEQQYEVIEEEHLEDVVYDYPTETSYVHDYSKFQNEESLMIEDEDDDEEEDEENIIEIDEEGVEVTPVEYVRRHVNDDVLFNEKDKYNIVDKDAVIKNPDRNSYAYRIYECFFCRLKFAGRKTYKAHDCQVKEVKCEVDGCEKVFTKQSGYNQHIMKIHGRLKRSKHFCPICKQVLNVSEIQFKQHCKQCSKDSNNKEQIIECEICKKKCKNIKSYVVHKMFHDAKNIVKVIDDNGSKKAPVFSGKGPVICELCGKEFTNCQGLRTHKKNVHLVGSKGEIFQCDICSKQRPTKRSLFNHMRNVHRVQKTPCNVCGKVFRTKALLQKHMMYHDETKRIHFCPLCPDKPGYFTGVALRRHQKSHHEGIKEYHCGIDYCDASFPTNVTLKQHKTQQHGVSVN
ncbi:hypothetical protein PVAND_009960 [Polypedilum vanderplanki]|uniref:Zinc finger protein n=1 Tax=Polypedilum vanderplanki TaxID=319348 RepID=A0A9J6CED7_POLVA|nr:hypothetical protein PVAND_009960 [Polypedilum vanderplanki]